jgi:hypothetical protein
MAEIFTDEGLDYLLGIALKGSTVDTTLYLGLFTSQTASTVPARGATGGASPSGWTEATGTSYARQALATGSWGANSTNGNGRRSSHSQVTFPAAGSGGWGTVNGFFIATASASGAGDTTICFANFDDLTAETINAGTVIRVTPTVQMDG